MPHHNENSALKYTDQDRWRIIQDLCKPLQLSTNNLIQIKELFLKDIKMGLRKKAHHNNVIANCYLTYVQQLPTGCRKGTGVCLDLSGTTLCITVMNCKGPLNFKFHQREYDIPSNLLHGTGTQIFNYVAECLSGLLKKLRLHNEKLAIAFSFGFAVHQYGLHSADLMSWSKNDNLPDVVKLLREAIERRKSIHISTIVLINDTTAVLRSCAFKNHSCKISVIVDNGCNASYMEEVNKIKKFKDTTNIPPSSSRMVINTELACFGDNDCLKFIETKWDERVSQLQPTANRRTFEKMTAGLYLGPLAREIILDAIKLGALFHGIITPALKKPNSFKISDMFDIESENRSDYLVIQRVLHKLGYESPTNEDCENIRYICKMVSQRSAHLIAATVACLIERIGDPSVVVGLDGDLFSHHPQYLNYFWETLKFLVKPEHNTDFVMSEYGTGCGAALLAVSAAKYQKILRRAKTKTYIVGNTFAANRFNVHR